MLWLFGTIAMATIEHTFDDVHVDGYGYNDDFDYQLRDSDPDALISVKPLDAEPVGEWYAVPGGARGEVRCEVRAPWRLPHHARAARAP